MKAKNDLLASLAAFGQERLLAFWDDLDQEQRELLVDDIDGIDFRRVADLYKRRDEEQDYGELARRMTPPPAFRLEAADNRVTPEEARRRGVEALRAGHVGVILVAGGQGTRLGFDHPKGMYPIGPISQKSLFRIHIEKIVASSRRHGAPIPLYLMTSPATRAETESYLAHRGRFGLPEEDLKPFCQATMPAVDADTGSVLLAEPHRVASSPDGHGGTLAALAGHGCLDDMRQRGLRHLFYLQVDNPLANVCSPESIGYHLICGSEMSTQVVAKQTASDRVGNVVQVDGRLHVIEYIHWDDVIEQQPDAADPKKFWAGSIAVHVFDRAFLERMADRDDVLPFHLSDKKKVNYVDPSGELVQPEKGNAIKFERFIFDLMPFADDAIVVEVDAHRDFGPLKNAAGAERDTPDTVKAQMVAVHREWLRQAGAEVADGVPVEISPLFALDAAELAEKIPAGTRISEPEYFH
ncbi:MAG TPA: UTP--glucose-1-phosphate uridylyltransferase [Thermoguttaceae bacterium]|nr:UTP--glucose-1-phosphate uridylyltransferase [Thermoguttaceae bacterium]